jgi:RNA polymerase sigma factor for flagellar operon FliA
VNTPSKTKNSGQLIEENQGLVRSLALKIHRKLPPHVELDDLVAYGQIGLAEAARDFDPSRGGRFSTYAYYRIRGEIYDGLAKMNWFSRSEYRRIRYNQMANDTLEADGAKNPAADGDDAEGELRWFRDISSNLAVVCIATQGDFGQQASLASMADPTAPDPPTVVISRETTHRLRQLIDTLPSEARKLIVATYFGGETLQEAGRHLGISKSWASRLHAKALEHLARSLRLVEAVS